MEQLILTREESKLERKKERQKSLKTIAVNAGLGKQAQGVHGCWWEGSSPGAKPESCGGGK